jgi:hypothetical protein
MYFKKLVAMPCKSETAVIYLRYPIMHTNLSSLACRVVSAVIVRSYSYRASSTPISHYVFASAAAISSSRSIAQLATTRPRPFPEMSSLSKGPVGLAVYEACPDWTEIVIHDGNSGVCRENYGKSRMLPISTYIATYDKTATISNRRRTRISGSKSPR